MSKRTYIFICTSLLNGQDKVRGANNTTTCIEAMMKAGITDIVIYPLPVPMSKLHGAKFVQRQPDFEQSFNVHQQATIQAYITKHDDGTDVVFDDVTVVEEAPVTAKIVLTFEEALAQTPVRSAKGHFIKKEVREDMARLLMETA